jgi:adenylate kinase family enzyme
MPLKLGLIGNTLSGRKTQAQKLCAKYGLVYIDPVDIVK